MSEETIIVYYSSMAGNSKIVSHQSKIEQILDAKKITYSKVDIATSEEDKIKMRQLMDNPTAVAPQLFNGNTYLGGFNEFEEANEVGELRDFLKLPPQQVES